MSELECVCWAEAVMSEIECVCWAEAVMRTHVHVGVGYDVTGPWSALCCVHVWFHFLASWNCHIWAGIPGEGWETGHYCPQCPVTGAAMEGTDLRQTERVREREGLTLWRVYSDVVPPPSYSCVCCDIVTHIRQRGVCVCTTSQRGNSCDAVTPPTTTRLAWKALALTWN